MQSASKKRFKKKGAWKKANEKWHEENGVSLSQGLMDYTKEDVEDEAESLDALQREESPDFDNDENEVDMDAVSPEMREASR